MMAPFQYNIFIWLFDVTKGGGKERRMMGGMRTRMRMRGFIQTWFVCGGSKNRPDLGLGSVSRSGI